MYGDDFGDLRVRAEMEQTMTLAGGHWGMRILVVEVADPIVPASAERINDMWNAGLIVDGVMTIGEPGWMLGEVSYRVGPLVFHEHPHHVLERIS